MIVMSYRSPWENRGTERGEEGRGNRRTHTQTDGGGLPGRKKKEKTSDELNGDKPPKTEYQYLL